MTQKFTIEPAPMAGYTDLAFRKVLRKCGARVTWTEMVSAAALYYDFIALSKQASRGLYSARQALKKRNSKSLQMLKTSGKTIVQLFGKNPAHFEAVIKSGILNNFTEININMGCPARKVTSNGDGCALMKNPKLAREIIDACVRVSKRPISVKMRLGFDKNVAVEFAKMCETAGASRLIVHGRLGTQGYSGKADWDAITEVVCAVKIPVIANGDVRTARIDVRAAYGNSSSARSDVREEYGNTRDAQSAAECIKATGAAGVMIGRALIGAPWRISNKRVNHKKIILYHIKQADNILELRKHLIAYVRDKEIKKRLAVVKSFEEAKDIINYSATSPSSFHV